MGRSRYGRGSGRCPLAESQSWIVASTVSLRAGPVRSHLACGTGQTLPYSSGKVEGNVNF